MLTAGNHFYNYRCATINADSFNVTAGGHFYNYRGAKSMRIALMLQQEVIFTIIVVQNQCE